MSPEPAPEPVPPAEEPEPAPEPEPESEGTESDECLEVISEIVREIADGLTAYGDVTLDAATARAVKSNDFEVVIWSRPDLSALTWTERWPYGQ